MSADLVNLFGPRPGSGPFVQGLLTAFDSNTGENTVIVSGTPFVNLPLLTTGATAFLQAGDVVMLANVGNAYAIIGRVDVPGSPSFARSSIGTDALTVYDNLYAIPHFTSSFAVCTANFLVPDWANTALFQAVGVTIGKNTTASTDYLMNWISITGQPNAYINNSQALTGQYATNACGTGFKLAVTPGSTVSVVLNLAAQNAAWGSDTGNESTLSASALYLSL